MHIFFSAFRSGRRQRGQHCSRLPGMSDDEKMMRNEQKLLYGVHDESIKKYFFGIVLVADFSCIKRLGPKLV
jgi:hypothetical protein